MARARSATKLWRGWLPALLAVAFAPTGFAATYYVAGDGSDDNDGLSVERPWRTIGRVNGGDLQPGDTVLLRRGDAWREQLVPRSGSEDGYVTYGAYGEGPKPLLLGSVARNEPGDWVDEGGNVWSTVGPQEVGREIMSQAADDLPWSLWCEPAASAKTARDEGEFDSAPASQRVDCTTSGAGGADIQFSLSPLSVEGGKLYRLTCRARASAPFDLNLPALMKTGPPWTGYAVSQPGGRGVATEWQTFEQYYLATVTADDARLTFYLGGAIPDGASLWVDGLRLAECRPGDWLPADVGNIIFDDEASCGVKKWTREDLKAPGDYWYDETNHVVKLYCEGNPAERYSSIELALRRHIIDQGGRSYVVYENLACKYGGAHGIGGGSTHHIIVRDCDFGYIGGGDQHGGDRTVRFGNGIEFWGTAHDNLVERCRLWEIYDAALTNQSGGPETPEYNLTYRNNVIWNSEYSFEYWNRPEASETYNVYFDNNTCVNAGHGWGHTQRPDPSGRHLCFYTSPARLHDVFIRNNVFFEAKTNAFYAPAWTKEQIDALSMDHNLWYQAEGVMISFKDAPYGMADFARYQAEWEKEPHSIVAIPGFVDLARLDFRLAPGSPCIDAGTDVGLAGDFVGVSVPQGRAPDIGAYERAGQ